ncbi:MAG: PD-(D/E)XK nuclease family protein [Agrobacterium tumefaciens]
MRADLTASTPTCSGHSCWRYLRATSRSSQTASRLKPLNVHLMDIEQADVRREWRSIDLLIVIPAEKLVIPIELKVEFIAGIRPASAISPYR